MGDCFIYNNAAWRLNYCVGGEVTTMFHLDRPMYLLGYLASQSRVYLIDKARAAARPVLPVHACNGRHAARHGLPTSHCLHCPKQAHARSGSMSPHGFMSQLRVHSLGAQ